MIAQVKHKAQLMQVKRMRQQRSKNRTKRGFTKTHGDQTQSTLYNKALSPYGRDLAYCQGD